MAFYTGYMEGIPKVAGSATDLIKKTLTNTGALVAAPAGVSYLAGRMHSKVQEPSSQETKLIQAQYVRKKLEQAISDLDKRKKMEQMKERQGGNNATLRI